MQAPTWLPGSLLRWAESSATPMKTGYTAASLTKLTELLPTPAYCTERIYLYWMMALAHSLQGKRVA